MNQETLDRKNRYGDICMEYVLRFCGKHDLTFDGWVGDRMGEIAEIGDMLLDFSDIRFDIDTEQEADEIKKWWDYTYDLATLECPKAINYRSWCAGAPLPYSQEQLNKIRKAHNDVATAKRVLENLMNGGDN